MSTSPLEQWNSIDGFTESFPRYNCAFLDILGYKHKALEYFDQRFNLYGRINRALATASVAQNITAALLNTSGLTIEIISDSIIMMQPAPKAGLGALLPFACHFASLLSFEGLFIRGGIAQGRHLRKRTDQGFDFLASEALQKAYLLESERAVHPRVLIDNDLIDILIPEERALVIRENSEYILHFSPHVINRQGGNVSEVLGEMRVLQSEMNRHSNEKIKLKYLWLLDYYYWTIANNPNWQADDFRTFSSGMNRGFSKLE
jgi:hypothetical protein